VWVGVPNGGASSDSCWSGGRFDTPPDDRNERQRKSRQNQLRGMQELARVSLKGPPSPSVRPHYAHSTHEVKRIIHTTEDFLGRDA